MKTRVLLVVPALSRVADKNLLLISPQMLIKKNWMFLYYPYIKGVKHEPMHVIYSYNNHESAETGY